MTTPQQPAAAQAVRALPKAELHLHIEGTLEPELAFALAARNGITLPHADAAALARAYDFSSLPDFLVLYYDCMQVLRTPQDFTDLAAAYLRRAIADGVVHTEIFFDPQAHTSRGVALADVIGGLHAAIDAEPGISAGLIACFLRDAGPAAAMSTLESLAPYAEQLIGVGLDSAEVGFPPAAFAEVFDAAAQLGLHRVAHAGEEGPPEYIWQALDVLGVERIDHGIRAAEDRALLRRLAADAMPLTLCPLSNHKLGAISEIGAHPLPTLLDAGLLLTINSDDPAYFGGYIGDNYDAVATAFSLDAETVARLAGNSLHASFLTEAQRQPYLSQLDGPAR